MKDDKGLELFCMNYSIDIREKEKWYDIKNNKLLNNCKISNYGRLINKSGIIRIPRYTKLIRYGIRDTKNNKTVFIRAVDLLCMNNPELYQEDKYLGLPIFKNKNSSDSYPDNLITYWSKSNISNKNEWKDVDGYDLMMSVKGDIVRKSNKELLRPTYKRSNGCYYLQNGNELDLAKASYILFHLNGSLQQYKNLFYDDHITLQYKDTNKENFSAENIYA